MRNQKQYAAKIGKHAGRAARLASQGKNEKAMVAAALAASERQLLHPQTWSLWAGASDDVFEKALSLISEEERQLLLFASNPHIVLENIVVELSNSSAKLRAIAALGVDLDAFPSEQLEEDGIAVKSSATPAIAIAWLKPLANLEALMIAGAKSPSPLDAKARDMFCNSSDEPKTVLQLIAMWGDENEMAKERGDVSSRMTGLVRWLAQDSGISVRNNKGMDALKIAVKYGKVELCKAILNEGGSLINRNASGLNVSEMAEKLALDAKREGDHDLGRRINIICSLIKAKTEAVELNDLLPSGNSHERSRPRI